MSDEVSLNQRAQHLFKVLVETYIRDGQPVASSALAKSSGLALSSATVRNVMSDLENLGLLHSPHTSAGRIPTQAGYRLFVDSLLQVEKLDSRIGQRVQAEFQRELETSGLVQTASDMLSRITGMAGVVTIPRRQQRALKQIDFLPLSDNRVLAILVYHPQEVQNKILHLDEPVSRDALQEAANYLNAQFVGKDVAGVRQQLLDELDALREDMNERMRSAIELGERALSDDAAEDADDCVVAGQENLMDFHELSDLQRLKELFSVFHSKREMLDLLDLSLRANGVQIFIGQESGYQTFNECSVIAAPYAADGKMLGVMAVIGPQRMSYEKVIPVVDMTSRLLSAALNEQ